MSIIGKEINKINIVFPTEYSKISFFETRESKNKNIKNTKNGRNIKIPIVETIGLGYGITAVPANNQITNSKSRQFFPNFFKF